MDRNIYKELLENDENHWWFQGRRTIVHYLLKRYFNGDYNILDVGSGAGGMIPLLQEFGQVTALEIDEEMVQSLKRRFGSELNIINESIFNLNASDCFSIITLFDVLEHINDDLSALNKVLTMLKEGGFFVCTVPAFQFLWSKHDEDAHHKRRYTKKELVSKLRACGFSIEHVTYFNTILFIPILLVRFLSRLLPRKNTDFALGQTGFLNKALYNIFASERLLLSLCGLPFGVSLFCIAKKST